MKALRRNVARLFASEANPVLQEKHPERRNIYPGAALGDIWKLKAELPPSGYGHLVYAAAVTDYKDLPRCCEVIDELRPDVYVICSANDMAIQRFANFQALPQCIYLSAYEIPFASMYGPTAQKSTFQPELMIGSLVAGCLTSKHAFSVKNPSFIHCSQGNLPASPSLTHCGGARTGCFTRSWAMERGYFFIR